MSIIQCSKNCKYQADGYCFLDKCSCVNSIKGECPYFLENLPDDNHKMNVVQN